MERGGVTIRRVASAISCVLLTNAMAFADVSHEIQDTSSNLDRGEYLAAAGHCAGCHTQNEHEPYGGGVAFNTDFGVIYSTNISPDTQHGIGSWSKADFRHAMRQGKRRNGEHLYPVFPYTAFTRMTDEDIDALYEYLQHQPAVGTPNQSNVLSFPFNQRALLGVWKFLFLSPGPQKPTPDQSESWNRGDYLVNAVGHCGLCHTPKNLLGADKKGQNLTGASYIDQVISGDYRPWYAVDLTGSSSGLADWTKRDIEDYLHTGLNRFSTAYGPMKDVVADSTRHLSKADRAAMAEYLKSLQPSAAIAAATKPVETVRKGQSPEGQSLYSIHCATCHLPTGLGSDETGPSMVGNPVVEGRDPSSLINVILYGPDLPDIQLPIQRTQMEAYKDQLSDEDIARLSTFMRQSWGNHAEPVSAEDVRQQR